jgi:NAD+ kinase
MRRSFKNILVVVKQTPYEQYMQLKNQGLAPVAVRWSRLKNRHEMHRSCVDKTTETLKSLGVSYSTIGREEMHRELLWDKDLVLCVGGDGTILSTACFLDDEVPLLGVNSDPTRSDEINNTCNRKDERRSRGALCAATTLDVEDILPRVIYGDVEPRERSRLQTIVKSTYTETRLPPALNDILVAHPSPAAVSRFRMTLYDMIEPDNYNPAFVKHALTEKPLLNELFSFNCWSSGMWVSTATGSTAAMQAAGGHKMDPHSKDLQYMVREHLTEKGDLTQNGKGHSDVHYNQMLHLRWNSQKGAVFVDGSHTMHELNLGDEISIEAHAPPVKLFERDDIDKLIN